MKKGARLKGYVTQCHPLYSMFQGLEISEMAFDL
jgi:hypothetical protein